MNQIKTGKLTGDNGLVYLPLGFIPNYFKMIYRGASSTNAVVYEWFKQFGELATIIDGWSFTDGVDAEIASASGIAAYDSAAQAPTITSWTQAVGSAATARSVTAHGTYVRPSSTSNTDRSAIFECVTDGTSAATEPTWPAGIGEQVTDGSTVWERVNVPETRVGYQGVRIAATMVADGYEAYFIAIESDEDVDFGDVDGWVGGVCGA
ncbi:MAG: hypothetical protein WC356_02755 [Candidatus Micrarchaeia archaeon]|jgi:hypothetical protein